MPAAWRVETQEQKDRFCRFVQDQTETWIYERKKPEKKRSLEANALSHVFYAEIARQKGDETPEDIRRHCKAYYAIPILLRDDRKFATDYDRLIRNRFTTEEKLELMGWFPVTSLMNKTQMKEYIEVLQLEYGKQGIILESNNISN